MHTRELGNNIYLIDLKTGNYPSVIASFVIKDQKATIIETGPISCVTNLLAGLKELDVAPVDVENILLTHVHIDHAGGAATLLKHLPNAKVYIHPKGMPHLVNPEKLWEASKAVLGYVADIFGKPESAPENRLVPINQGTVKLAGGREIKVIETLGHSPHHLCFFDQQSEGIFVGEAAGQYIEQFDAILPTTPPPFFLDSALKSLDQLIALNPKVNYYSHFGVATNGTQHLKAYKEQLQQWANITIEGVKAKKDRASIFEDIRKQDKTLDKLFDFLEANKIYAKTSLENGLDGFIGYAHKILGS